MFLILDRVVLAVAGRGDAALRLRVLSVAVVWLPFALDARGLGLGAALKGRCCVLPDDVFFVDDFLWPRSVGRYCTLLVGAALFGRRAARRVVLLVVVLVGMTTSTSSSSGRDRNIERTGGT